MLLMNLYTISDRKVGEVATLRVNNRHIYYLITKEKYSNKPTYDTLRSSLESMKHHSVQHKVSHIAMPKIGCGLDRLRWDRVKAMLHDLFKDLDMSITVYYL